MPELEGFEGKKEPEMDRAKLERLMLWIMASLVSVGSLVGGSVLTSLKTNDDRIENRHHVDISEVNTRIDRIFERLNQESTLNAGSRSDIAWIKGALQRIEAELKVK